MEKGWELSAHPCLAESGEPCSGGVSLQRNPIDFGEGQAMEAESVEGNRIEVVVLDIGVPYCQTDEPELLLLAT